MGREWPQKRREREEVPRKLRGVRVASAGAVANFARMALDPGIGEPRVRPLPPAARPPVRARPGDAAFDLRCSQGFSLWPREHATVATGVAIALPAGVAGLVTP